MSNFYSNHYLSIPIYKHDSLPIVETGEFDFYRCVPFQDSFYGKTVISAEDAYQIFEAMAEIHGTTNKLKKWAISKSDAKQEEAAKTIARQRREKFEFAKIGIPVGAELEFIHDRSIKVSVADEKRKVLYNGEEWTLSALAKVLLKRDGEVQGTLHFSYNGETISDLRNRLEDSNSD